MATVHPHARGDLADRASAPSTAVHPHARGDLHPAEARRDHARSIPTRVGISTACSVDGFALAVHPHARGDLFGARPDRSSVAGPSPRAWGSRVACGGHGLRVGPSPRAWGSRLGAWLSSPPGRSIPTRVGISRTATPAPPPPPTHPPDRGGARSGRSIPTRVGISRWRACAAARATGPSPRAWGSPRPREPS